MNFRVVDEQGRVLGEGRDLVQLQRQMAGEVRESLQGASDNPWERAGLTDWDFGELPEAVEMQQHGLALKVFPALADEGATVALRLFESREAADASHRKGVARLFALQNHDKIKYLQKNLPGSKSLCLHYVSLGRCEELIASIIAAAVEATLYSGGALPRTHSAYEAMARDARTALIDSANRIAALAGESLAGYHRIQKQLKGAVQPQWLNSLADIREQLQHLMVPGFIATMPGEWLEHLPRYMQALERRLEKLRSDPQRDRQLLLELQPLWQRFWARCGGEGECPDIGVQRFRWLLEELRVSLFAQELKTVETVSVPRLEKLWKQLVSGM
jgi:ATP-dependent helicase HrpA